jgi:hypothetical protein
MDVWDASGNLAFRMRDNDWILAGKLRGVDCPPSARSLAIKDGDRGVGIGLEFVDLTSSQLRVKINGLFEGREHSLAASIRRGVGAPDPAWAEYIEQLIRETMECAPETLYDAIRAAVGTETVTVCIVTAALQWPFMVRLHEKYSEFPNRHRMIGNFLNGCETAVSIES